MTKYITKPLALDLGKAGMVIVNFQDHYLTTLTIC